MNDGSFTLFDLDEFTSWKREWKGMPEFEQDDINPFSTIEVCFCYKREDNFPQVGVKPYRTLNVHFENLEDLHDFSNLINIKGITSETNSIWYCESVETFAKLLNQNITPKTLSLWHPKYKRDKPSNYLYTKGNVEPKYPFYIISKGRWDKGTTRKAFDKLGIKYRIVVEKHEFENYANFIDSKNLLILPQKYLDEYDTFSNLGDINKKGPGAARNFCWDNSISEGAKRHWVFDDNVSCFYRLNRNRRLPVEDGTMFRVMEDFVDRYENIAIAGPNYLSYAPDRCKLAPYSLNTRIYSMLLIDNKIPYRWRGRYNEDTDLSLRALKDGLCTCQFNAFLGDKATTQTMQGGNTAEFYEQEGTKNKSQMLVDMHPDVARIVWRFERWHHEVNYDPYKRNKLKLIEGITIEDKINNYGMELKKVIELSRGL